MLKRLNKFYSSFEKTKYKYGLLSPQKMVVSNLKPCLATSLKMAVILASVHGTTFVFIKYFFTLNLAHKKPIKSALYYLFVDIIQYF